LSRSNRRESRKLPWKPRAECGGEWFRWASARGAPWPRGMSHAAVRHDRRAHGGVPTGSFGRTWPVP